MQRIPKLSSYLLLVGLLTAGSLCMAQPKGRFLRLRQPNTLSLRYPPLGIRDLSKWQKFANVSHFRPVMPKVQADTPASRPLYAPTNEFAPLASAHVTTPLASRIAKTGMLPKPVSFPGKQEVDAIIFDLDGTLLNSLAAWEHSGSNFVRSQGFEPPEELDEKLVKMSLRDGAVLIKEMYHLSYTPEEIIEMTLRPIKNHYYQDIQPMPGVPELLARLKAQGVKMVVATASHKEFAQAALLRLGLMDYFEFIVTCDEVGIGKTSPRVYEVAAERLGTPAARTLVAEDALYALETASRAGFKTAAIEEKKSAHQRAAKQAVADYYVVSYFGQNTFAK